MTRRWNWTGHFYSFSSWWSFQGHQLEMEAQAPVLLGHGKEAGLLRTTLYGGLFDAICTREMMNSYNFYSIDC